MSGVMTKVAVYGFVRIVFDLMGPPDWWWSIVVLGVGSITAVLGVLSAVMQRDLKRLLAYSTVENIGIIFIGLGLALAFKANGMLAAAALAFTAALLHAFNHSLFKSLLFFGAGAVQQRHARARHREARRPDPSACRITAFLLLGGCVAISALPPLNGFVSEWLIFQAVLMSPELPQWGLKLMVPAVGAMLALGAALSAACFVRAFGVAFLGRPRIACGERRRRDRRASRARRWALLLALCLAVGPPARLRHRRHGAGGAACWSGTPCRRRAASPGCRSCRSRSSRNSYNGLLFFMFITVSTLITIEIIHRFASRAVRRGPAWDCGFPDPEPRHAVHGRQLRPADAARVRAMVFRAREHVDMPPPGDASPARLTVTLRDLVWDTVCSPRWRGGSRSPPRSSTICSS